MLKKLVKHGNSNALILDRSILALLDIDENTVLKLRIEGDTLLVKAAEAVPPSAATQAQIETLHEEVKSSGVSRGTQALCDANEARFREYCKEAETDRDKADLLEEFQPGTEKAAALQQMYAEIMKKYQPELAVLSGQEFQEELGALSQKYADNPEAKEFHEEFLLLRLKHAPKLAEMDREMEEAAAKLGASF